MGIELREVRLGGPRSALLPTVSVVAAEQALTVIAVDTDERPMLLSLLLAGRLKPSAGEVLIDGRADPRELRRRVALIDTPYTAEPDPGVPVRTIVAEELSFAGHSAHGLSVDAVLEQVGVSVGPRVPIRELPTTQRLRLLCTLALLREGVDTLVITSPERHGGNPRELLAELDAIVSAGRTAIVVTDAATTSALEAARAERPGREHAPNPVPPPPSMEAQANS